jgi:ABC-2 type transport system permease protein
VKKYLTLFTLAWQKQLEVRSDFLFERVRSLCIMVSLYFLWSTLLQNQTSLWTYSKNDLLTYVFLMTFLRAWVLASVTYRMPVEIARGKISDLLLRPISPFAFWATQDAANKVLNVSSSILELALFSYFVSFPFVLPNDVSRWIGFIASTLLAIVMYFQMSYMLGSMGFWTSESMGPWFCFEVFMEFCAGAYFPIDLMPAVAQSFFKLLPFPYLVFYPISIFLGKLSGPEMVRCLAIQSFWIFVLGLGVRLVWRAGMRRFAAEGG